MNKLKLDIQRFAVGGPSEDDLPEVKVFKSYTITNNLISAVKVCLYTTFIGIEDFLTPSVSPNSDTWMIDYDYAVCAKEYTANITESLQVSGRYNGVTTSVDISMVVNEIGKEPNGIFKAQCSNSVLTLSGKTMYITSTGFNFTSESVIDTNIKGELTYTNTITNNSINLTNSMYDNSVRVYVPDSGFGYCISGIGGTKAVYDHFTALYTRKYQPILMTHSTTGLRALVLSGTSYFQDIDNTSNYDNGVINTLSSIPDVLPTNVKLTAAYNSKAPLLTSKYTTQLEYKPNLFNIQNWKDGQAAGFNRCYGQGETLRFTVEDNFITIPGSSTGSEVYTNTHVHPNHDFNYYMSNGRNVGFFIIPFIEGDEPYTISFDANEVHGQVFIFWQDESFEPISFDSSLTELLEGRVSYTFDSPSNARACSIMFDNESGSVGDNPADLILSNIALKKGLDSAYTPYESLSLLPNNWRGMIAPYRPINPDSYASPVIEVFGDIIHVSGSRSDKNSHITIPFTIPDSYIGNTVLGDFMRSDAGIHFTKFGLYFYDSTNHYVNITHKFLDGTTQSKTHTITESDTSKVTDGLGFSYITGTGTIDTYLALKFDIVPEYSVTLDEKASDGEYDMVLRDVTTETSVEFSELNTKTALENQSIISFGWEYSYCNDGVAQAKEIGRTDDITIGLKAPTIKSVKVKDDRDPSITSDYVVELEFADDVRDVELTITTYSPYKQITKRFTGDYFTFTSTDENGDCIINADLFGTPLKNSYDLEFKAQTYVEHDDGTYEHSLYQTPKTMTVYSQYKPTITDKSAEIDDTEVTVSFTVTPNYANVKEFYIVNETTNTEQKAFVYDASNSIISDDTFDKSTPYTLKATFKDLDPLTEYTFSLKVVSHFYDTVDGNDITDKDNTKYKVTTTLTRPPMPYNVTYKMDTEKLYPDTVITFNFNWKDAKNGKLHVTGHRLTQQIMSNNWAGKNDSSLSGEIVCSDSQFKRDDRHIGKQVYFYIWSVVQKSLTDTTPYFSAKTKKGLNGGTLLYPMSEYVGNDDSIASDYWSFPVEIGPFTLEKPGVPVIDFFQVTSSTQTSITVNVSATPAEASTIKGYEFSYDNGMTWSISQTSTSYTFTSLSPNTSYNLKVRVTNNLDDTTTSDTLVASTVDTSVHDYRWYNIPKM